MPMGSSQANDRAGQAAHPHDPAGAVVSLGPLSAELVTKIDQSMNLDGN
jgi:hypothetical protein